MIVVSGEPRDSHDLAMLIAAGASAVNPYLAIDQVRALAEQGVVNVDPVVAQENYRSALQSGLLKVMSKMGICTVSAYRGSELFEVIGLGEEVCELSFRNAPRRFTGLGLEQVAGRVLELHSRYRDGEEFAGGFYKHRGKGSLHITSPGVVLSLQKAVRSGDGGRLGPLRQPDPRPAALGHPRSARLRRRGPRFRSTRSSRRERIMRRFVASAMSHGGTVAGSARSLAEAMNQIGGYSNSGEGGEGPERFGSPRNSAIKQVASARFGVTPEYLASAEELQIKMAQGSKPGEGGQLPGHKVTAEIARLRHTEPGVTLISPPPHHDIYSIEDLAQLIFDLKAFSPSGSCVGQARLRARGRNGGRRSGQGPGRRHSHLGHGGRDRRLSARIGQTRRGSLGAWVWPRPTRCWSPTAFAAEWRWKPTAGCGPGGTWSSPRCSVPSGSASAPCRSWRSAARWCGNAT